MKILSILLLALSANYSFAGHHSEALWQAHGGDNVINAGYTYGSQTWHVEDNQAAELTFNSHLLNLSYERGLNDMFSIGLGLDYINMDTGPAPAFEGSGLNNINVSFKGNNHLGFGHIHYGVNARFTLEDLEYNAFESNAALGRHEIVPYIGLMMGDRASMTYGLRVDYQINTTRTDVDEANNDAETELEDGNVLTAQLFFEKALTDKSVFGLSFDYVKTDFLTTEINGADADVLVESNLFNFSAYGAISCGCDKAGLTFLPRFTLSMGDGEANNFLGLVDTDVETGASYSMEFAVRKVF